MPITRRGKLRDAPRGQKSQSKRKRSKSRVLIPAVVNTKAGDQILLMMGPHREPKVMRTSPEMAKRESWRSGGVDERRSRPVAKPKRARAAAETIQSGPSGSRQPLWSTPGQRRASTRALKQVSGEKSPPNDWRRPTERRVMAARRGASQERRSSTMAVPAKAQLNPMRPRTEAIRQVSGLDRQKL